MPTALASLSSKLPVTSLQKVTLANSLANLSGDNVPLVKALTKQPGLTSLRDVALNFNVESLAAIVDPQAVPANTPGATADEKKTNLAIALRQKLFYAEPTAVLQRMVHDTEVPIADSDVRAGVTTFLSNQPNFNIRTTSVYTALKGPDALKGIADGTQANVVEQLKTLQRVQAVSPIPEAVPLLMKANLTSAFRIAELPESTFMNSFSGTLGEQAAKQVYTNAINTHIRNEHALITMRESIRGSGLAIIDGGQSAKERLPVLQAIADQKAVPLNLETLFGSIDNCECDDCLSVYSPAAILVEYFQYLRNNDLGPDPTTGDPNPADNKNIHPGLANTPLEKLFRRRPDLGCLELTCENTFTVLPYIDLVNEIMESFIVHLDKYHADGNVPKQATLDVFNVTDETTSDLLAQPQHINYQAYSVLQNAVYPFTLPYHQPIDTIRVFLKNFGTSRYQLLDTFRTASETTTAALTPDQQKQLQVLHVTVLDRAVDAEFLAITQEEYIILTKEAFWPKDYFDLTLSSPLSQDDYRNKIGVRLVSEYYGYSSDADMLSVDENPTTGQKGLTFVKKQFLPRTGIQYTDLVDLLKTQFINPAYPQGQALAILDSIRFSYRFLQTLVDTSSTDRTIRFAKLIAFLTNVQPLVPVLDAMLNPDPCHQQDPAGQLQAPDFQNWVYCYFERIGQLIVLESGEGPQLPVSGTLVPSASPEPVATLHQDGTITNAQGSVIGYVQATAGTVDNAPAVIAGPLTLTDGKTFSQEFGTDSLWLTDASGTVVGDVSARGVMTRREGWVTWVPARDTCDLDKVRLTHLDGSAVTGPEYDRIHRFIRLWRKLGWTIAQTDQALIGVSALAAGGGSTASLSGGMVQGDGNCPDIPNVPQDISCDFIHQLVAVRKLVDLTGLDLDKALSFWADISTAGDNSLYSRLFLTHNILGIDKIFEADTNGNYLMAAGKITDHLPVLLAALKLKVPDINAIMTFRSLPDALTLSNLSALYRHGLLAKLLHVQVADLPEVIALFGDPFASAQDAVGLLQDWGNMEDAGFTFRQLDYIIRDQDDPKRPLGPSDKKILQVTRTLYDGLNGIDDDHPDVPADPDQATDDVVRANAGLLFAQSMVDVIVGFLDGTTIYTTNTLKGLTISIPDPLAQKLKYDPVGETLQVTGILTDDESKQAKALVSDAQWAAAVDRLAKQAVNLFNDVLLAVFPDSPDAKTNLLIGDVNVPPDPDNPSATDNNTAPTKRLYFLQHFLPFLRQRLSHRLIVDTLSGIAGLAGDVTDVLLSDVLITKATSEAAVVTLQKIKDPPPGNPSGWKGYLIPPADDMYTFIATTDTGDPQPAPLLIDGVSLPFPNQRDDPSNIWSTNPIKLKTGKLYALELTDLKIDALQWSTSATPFIPATPPKSLIPASALLPDYSSAGTSGAFVSLFKAALLVRGFNLSADEVSYWQNHPADFDGFDFNAVTTQHWRRLQAYTSLRDSLPQVDTTLLDLFGWASSNPADAATLSKRLATVTLWAQNDIDRLIAPEHFDLNRPEAFSNEVNLVKLQNALAIANATGAAVDLLFQWADPRSNFVVCLIIAQLIRATLRARYDQTEWEQVVKSLNDQLREHQKQALISYLLVQRDLIDWGVVDADSLFEFFLIDVQMCACMETSRIKQAISSVQLFVQRCLLGLEAQYGVSATLLDRDRWNWMRSYPLWQANRQVYVHPENWLDAPRDDLSPPFTELGSDLLQKDINIQTVEDALKTYLFKVDEVANLKVVGLFLEQGIDADGNFSVDTQTGAPVYLALHVFARARNAPYLFYYRYLDLVQGNWHAWEAVQVDIPSYDLEDSDGHFVENGSYVIPMVWKGRLLVFFPQIAKKATPPAPQNLQTSDAGEIQIPVQDNQPSLSWEIKLAWSELRNGKWGQKQVSTGALYGPFSSPATSLNVLYLYQFIPELAADAEPRIHVIVRDGGPLKPGSNLGYFEFTGSQLFLFPTTLLTSPSEVTDFHMDTDDNSIHSLQTTDLMNGPPYFVIANGSVTGFVDPSASGIPFYHPFVHELLGAVATRDLPGLFDYYLNKIPDDSTTVPHKVDAFGGTQAPAIYHELKRAYSLYNWEAAFHAPMAIVDRLLAAQQFDQALAICHYVLNPYAPGPDTDPKRFWQFFPFREIDATTSIEQLFLGLQPNQPDNPADMSGPINEWRDNPFEPHLIARSRPSAYMKWVAMKYIQILIAYGDYYFVQNSLDLATQCYVLASHVYGPRAQKIPKRGKMLPETYNSLLDKWDAFGNAMVELELVFPFSNQTSADIGTSNGVVGLANVFGFATTLYFCIPDNPQLQALRDTIDDRLFKIRHCQDINGVFRQLPLFEPPIDPGLLVAAAAQGLSLSSVLNDLTSPMPNYRFNYQLQKALELCAEVKALGNAFLAAKEKGDAEALARLHATHESSIQKLVMEVKKQQVDEATKALDALQQSRRGPVYRLQHYLKLIGQDLSAVPDTDADFTEIPDQIEQPVDESGLKLIQYEKEEMDKATAAADLMIGIGAIESLGGMLYEVPEATVAAHPFGVGADIKIGGQHFGSAAQANARALRIVSDHLSYQSSSAGRKAGFLRQLQDRVQQANIAGYEIKSIDKQILTQQIRIAITNQEITNQQKQIDNAQEVEDFLHSKYTNQELYSWMDGQVRGLYYQLYTLAYAQATKAEKLYRFERGLATSDFIQFGYWDIAHDGLLAGERLYLGLKQLETANCEKPGYDFEVSKSISLRQLNPFALIKLRETGSCEFSVPEVLHDMDRSGDILRRVKSISFRMPCTLGPCTSLNCTIRLLEHKFRWNNTRPSQYVENTDDGDDRFMTVNVPVAAVAISSLEEESGVFEPTFHGERYLPIEGAGAICKLGMELPNEFRQFDYDTITDVIIRMRYTSVDGGEKLKAAAAKSVMDYVKMEEGVSQEDGLFAAFDLKHDFPTEWYSANHPLAGATQRVLTIDKLSEKLPFFTKGRKVQATNVYLFISASPLPAVTASQNGSDLGLSSAGQSVGTMTVLVANDVGTAMDSLQITIGDTTTVIDKMWLVERYILSTP